MKWIAFLIKMWRHCYKNHHITNFFCKGVSPRAIHSKKDYLDRKLEYSLGVVEGVLGDFPPPDGSSFPVVEGVAQGSGLSSERVLSLCFFHSAPSSFSAEDLHCLMLVQSLCRQRNSNDMHKCSRCIEHQYVINDTIHTHSHPMGRFSEYPPGYCHKLTRQHSCSSQMQI